jgi:ABC-type transport system substrate-binding protein
VLPIGFASSAAGGMNAAQVSDDQLDKLLLATRTNMDPDKRQAAVNDVVKYMMDRALCIPLYVPDDVYALSTRLAGVNFSTATVSFWFNDAYVKK